jgi:hypothetical protein
MSVSEGELTEFDQREVGHREMGNGTGRLGRPQQLGRFLWPDGSDDLKANRIAINLVGNESMPREGAALKFTLTA